MKKLKKEEVEELLKSRPRKRTECEYADEIAALKSGEALHVTAADWKRKTQPTHYFCTKYNTRGKQVLSVFKIRDGEFLVMKL